MKKILLLGIGLAALMVSQTVSFAQQSVLSSPTKSEIESAVGGMGLSLEQKMSLRSILQGMQEQGQKVKENSSLSNDQKVTQIVQIRQNALSQTQSILSASQQQQFQALLLPGQ